MLFIIRFTCCLIRIKYVFDQNYVICDLNHKVDDLNHIYKICKYEISNCMLLKMVCMKKLVHEIYVKHKWFVKRDICGLDVKTYIHGRR